MAKPGSITFDEERKEHIIKIEFNSAQKFVPNDIYKVSRRSHSLQLVHEDNYRFMCERQVFSNPFFESMKNLLSVMIEKSPGVLFDHEADSEKLFDFTFKLVFDLSAMTTENKHLLELTKSLLSMLNCNDVQLRRVIHDYILVDKSKLGKDEKGFFESLISHSEKDVREMNATLLAFVVNRLFALNDMETVDALMSQAFALFPEDLSKYWLKLHQYLSVSLASNGLVLAGGDPERACAGELHGEEQPREQAGRLLPRERESQGTGQKAPADGL